ncbi:arginine repressor [Desulfolucanica intricata]|uniref:arginine repressor n=1 Tax=Desulfolucanica intricata TaxID=1285191 RepID=UPI00082DD8F9|nr:arginine repressor [Desulfolucanica intricata]
MKSRRLKAILDIVSQQVVETQEELVNALQEAGFTVTQATISRDIKELGLIKMPGENGVPRYFVPSKEPLTVRNNERLKRLLRDSVVKIDASENLIIIKTLPGEAQGVASALDHSGWSEVIGTVGGDDTILVVVKPKKATQTVIDRLEDIAGGGL